jgi:hypothetical protein
MEREPEDEQMVVIGICIAVLALAIVAGIVHNLFWSERLPNTPPEIRTGAPAQNCLNFDDSTSPRPAFDAATTKHFKANACQARPITSLRKTRDSIIQSTE